MKICIATEFGQDVCPHFGRASEYTFITIEDNKIIDRQVLPNPGHSVGSIPQFVNDQKANYMIAGGMGQRAVAFFNQFGIDVVVGVQGRIDDVIEKILKGEISTLGGKSLCSPGEGKASGRGVDKILTEADFNRKGEHDHQH
ncbi:MAG: NifB/NifX family molybdenum-iron cluster-binding protein [Promethearchaeota archaeon]